MHPAWAARGSPRARAALPARGVARADRRTVRASVAQGFSGILNVDKPPGMTSHDVVAAVRRIARQRKVGHAGTLDPLATGVLLVCLGRATRVAEYLMRSPKTYRAEIRLGVTTTTDDAEGEVMARCQVALSRAQVEEVLQGFEGRIAQVPPRYSAIKRQGERMYALARRGIEVDPPARDVDVYALRLVGWAPPLCAIEVRCGPGTYIRALARDVGTALGCGAHLASLRRTSSGVFAASDAASLEAIEDAFQAGREAQILHPLDAALSDLPALQLGAQEARRVAMGQQVDGAPLAADPELARAYAPNGQFVAVLQRAPRTGGWRPSKVFVRPEEIPLE
ncbi:MAG: tRNA pseudouridine(55) synthase TruB [Anaerolineae bacterium]|nr:tRNA pseudouridine(55) synthase TruB [Anaerolineae bacterium]